MAYIDHYDQACSAIARAEAALDVADTMTQDRADHKNAQAQALAGIAQAHATLAQINTDKRK